MLVCPLASIPAEVLEHIAFQLTCLQPLGPPSGLVPLLLTCKTVHIRLSSNSALYARIFQFKFDSSAVRRRAFHPTPAQYHDQLVLYCTQLQRLRGPVWRDCDEVLFSAYLMMLENDGRNAAQLVHAGLDSYLDIFVRTRLWDDRSHGWPTDNTATACALWLVWMTTTEEKLKAESPGRRNQIIRLVLPYVLVPYRYASAFAPPHHFNVPLLQNAAVSQRHANSIVTSHGPYPIYLDPQRAWSQVHFSSRPAMAPPLATVAAKLIYFSRRETVPFSIPSGLPLNREAAMEAGITDVRPTQEDIIEVNEHLNSRLPEMRDGWGRYDPAPPLSETWDSDWWRLRKCFDAYSTPDTRLGPCYAPGMLTGLWQGRMLVSIPSENHLNALVSTEAYPRDFDEAHLGTTTFPLYMRIVEHHSHAPDVPVPCGASDGWDDGLANAFFPPEARFLPHDGYRDERGRRRGQGVTVRANVNGEDRAYEYVTYDRATAGDSENHDPDACPWCRLREESMRTQRAEVAAAAAAAHYELVERMGMGHASCTSTTAPDVEFDEDDADAAEDSDSDSDEMETETETDDDSTPPAHDPARMPPCTGIQDIIFTGATDLRHGQAWNHFDFYGRVRLWDGLVTLLRVSPDPRIGTLFFYGFIVGGHKFVGNWRVTGQDVGVPVYESAFSMARRDEDD
ncbi:hypothetical protein B0H12DRAFT_1146219 [Mycena haematopus]|nr:hypothetical protein B0H12DRAFT_1146219 [Mycena haematopus]